MMRKCRHEVVTDHAWWVQLYGQFNRHESGLVQNLMEWRTCDLCGEVVPLGEASDTPETTIETAAAEIAANWDAYQDMRWGAELGGLVGMGTSANAEQYLDICIRERDAGRQDRIRDVRDLEIGLLAREIASHGEQGGER